jgi:hypothetical protein
MKLDDAALKPASAALLELDGFLNFDHAQQSDVKGSRLFFFACWHGQLYVIDGTKGETVHVLILSAVFPAHHPECSLVDSSPERFAW